jgi:lipopolysaccharide transport system ATP-binding protein
MPDPIITIEALSKRYMIGRQGGQSDGLRHALEHAFRPWNWRRSAGQRRSTREQEFWALRDVNLDIRQGEIVGIIGRNGAGKSTLLKILSRITEPTAGRIRLRGRTASLLEVGTGFHGDLTGRENIYLNGAILGMTRSEIKRKFDEIVEFAGVETFLDTPVKRYSSGMYVRLAFAIAAHLEPEILIVDEVLAVGDAEFQKKCLDKMDDVSHGGRTVLFVSHNMQAVTRLSTRCVLLDRGEVKLEGPPHSVASAYLSSGVGLSSVREWSDQFQAPGDDVVRLCAVRLRAPSGELVETVDIRHSVGVELEYEVQQGGYVFHPHFGVVNEDGVWLFIAQDVDPVWRRRPRPPGRYVSTGWIPGNFLAEGAFSIDVTLMTLEPERIHTTVNDAVHFRVVDDLAARDTARGDYRRPIGGVVRPLLKWTTSYTPSGTDGHVPEGQPDDFAAAATPVAPPWPR